MDKIVMKDLGNGFVACCQLDDLFPWSEVDTWFEDNEEGHAARKEIKDKLERGDLYFFTCWTQERCKERIFRKVYQWANNNRGE